MPKTIPSAMLYVSGIMMMVIKAGMASVYSLKLIFRMGDSIKNPTSTRAGAVAAAGTIVKKGARNRASKKNAAVVSEVRPVFPPSATPEALSTYVVTVLVPNTAPTVVPMESAKSACFTRGTFPSSSSIPALEETPTSVPTVSNISTNRKVNNTISISKEKIFENSSCAKMGVSDGGIAISAPTGI